ncbi:MAG: alpha/beta hydrolase [Ktedonobacteraceae bacterium]
MRNIQGWHLPTYTIKVNGLPIFYQRIGEGEPLVLVHGLAGSTRWWERNVKSLAERHCVYLVDLPGFGSMHRAGTRFALGQAGSWLLQWMEALGIQKAHLLGHSMGGFICLWIAAHHPEKVLRLILVSPAILHQVHTLWGYLFPILQGVRYLTLPFAWILLWDSLRMGPFTLLRAAQSLLKESLGKEIKTVQAPTLLIWGEGDTIVPASLGHVLRGEMHDARLLIIKRAGHVSMFDQPRIFNQAANDFLAGKIVGE